MFHNNECDCWKRRLIGQNGHFLINLLAYYSMRWVDMVFFKYFYTPYVRFGHFRPVHSMVWRHFRHIKYTNYGGKLVTNYFVRFNVRYSRKRHINY